MSVYATPQTIPLQRQAGAPSAFLVKFPEAVWQQILDNVGQKLSVSMSQGQMSLQIGGSQVPLDAHTTNNHTEIHRAGADALAQVGHASVRLTVPFEPQASVPPRLAAVPLERSHSSPAAPPRTANVPLKTRVVQLLALGNLTAEEIAAGVKAPEADAMRVAKIVGRQVSSDPARYSLLPSQYSKIKLSEWSYTKEELDKVVNLSRAAFDELGFAPDAPEWADLDRRAAQGGATDKASAAVSNVSAVAPTPTVIPSVPQKSPLSKVTQLRAGRDRATSVPTSSKTLASAASATSSSTTPVSNNADIKPKPSDPSIKAADTKAKATDLQSKSSKNPKPKPKRRRDSRTPQFTSSEDESPSTSGDSNRTKRTKRGDRVEKRSDNAAAADPDQMRDRYDELYPAYQKLTQKLAAVHEAAERDQIYTPLAETRQMVAKWEKWHAELSRIRMCFGEL